MSPTVGVIGLGPMGGNIAGNLLGNGFAVAGFDIRPVCMEALADAGLMAAGSSAEVARRADILATSLPNMAALEDVMDGLLRQPKPGQILIECSTLTVEQKVAAHGRSEARRDALSGFPHQRDAFNAGEIDGLHLRQR